MNWTPDHLAAKAHRENLGVPAPGQRSSNVVPIDALIAPTHNIPAGHVGSIDFLKRTGITYRRLDYWTRCGLLHTPDTSPGSGGHRTYPVAEIPVAIIMRDLSAAGVEIRVAHVLARDLLATGTTVLAGIRLELPQEQL